MLRLFLTAGRSSRARCHLLRRLAPMRPRCATHATAMPSATASMGSVFACCAARLSATKRKRMCHALRCEDAMPHKARTQQTSGTSTCRQKSTAHANMTPSTLGLYSAARRTHKSTTTNTTQHSGMTLLPVSWLRSLLSCARALAPPPQLVNYSSSP